MSPHIYIYIYGDVYRSASRVITRGLGGEEKEEEEEENTTKNRE
jgi:hypothetical protein